MLKKTIIGFMLALFAGPLSAHAEMPGQPCTAAQIGTTKMADDKQNIIACLLTGKAAPENVQEWKAMTSSGGGGLTGGCNASMSQYDASNVNTGPAVRVSILVPPESLWGTGCNPAMNNFHKVVKYAYSGYGICSRVALPDYSCGSTFSTSNDDGKARHEWCQCIKK